ncbi:MAG: ABC transporter permease [Sphingomicrobium sp.]
MRELIRAAFVIARRDFTATVFSRVFLLFLLGPLFPIAMGALFGSIGGRIAASAEQPTVAVVASAEEFRALASARERLATGLRQTPIIRLAYYAPGPDPAAQRARLLQSQAPPVLGVLEGGLGKPRFTGAVAEDGNTVGQLRLMIEDARQIGAAAQVSAGTPMAVQITSRSSGSLVSYRALTAQAGQALLFLLTILLAGMLLSQLIEEKSNKIIEVLAAAVPIDAIFLGKLMAMLTMSLLGITVWTTAGAAGIALYAEHGLSALTEPAVGWPIFLGLTLVYFAMSYLLLGSVFLGIGAQASTVREVQTLSMPVTMAQVLVFGFAASAVGDPGSTHALAAAAFPLSSPYVMIARAAEQPGLWPHLVAIVWQLLWVALILRVAARLFRRSVLQSGPTRRWWRRAAKT